MAARFGHAVGSKSVGRIGGEADPLHGGVEGVAAFRVSRGHVQQAAQRVVHRAREAGAPFHAGVEADLADDIDHQPGLRSATASLPLYQLEPFVWFACAMIAAAADACASTWTPPGAT